MADEAARLLAAFRESWKSGYIDFSFDRHEDAYEVEQFVAALRAVVVAAGEVGRVSGQRREHAITDAAGDRGPHRAGLDPTGRHGMNALDEATVLATNDALSHHMLREVSSSQVRCDCGLAFPLPTRPYLLLGVMAWHLRDVVVASLITAGWTPPGTERRHKSSAGEVGASNSATASDASAGLDTPPPAEHPSPPGTERAR